MSEHEIREGFYRDKYGRWQPDRRKSNDRRAGIGKSFALEHERRGMFRRKADRELFEKDHRAEIDDALRDFAEDHDGHL